MTNRIASAIDYLNTELLGKEKETPLMRGMCAGSVGRNPGRLNYGEESFKAILQELVDDGGFVDKRPIYERSLGNFSPDPRIAASYAVSKDGANYIALVLDRSVEGNMILEKEYQVSEAGWDDIDSVLVPEGKKDTAEEMLGDVKTEVYEPLTPPNDYTADPPASCLEENHGEFRAALYTLKSISDL